MSLTVALVTDVHHGSDSRYVKGTLALPLLEKVLEEIAGRRPALLIDLGDRVNDSALDTARAALAEVADLFRQVQVPSVHLLGNNDVTARGEQEAVLGAPLGNRSLALGGWRLVFLDAFDGSVEGVLTPRTLEWLERTLTADDLPAIVFSHQPLDGKPLPDNPFFGGDSYHQAHPRGHEKARAIMQRSKKVALALSGHAHWNHRVTVGGVHYLTLAALVPYAREEDEGGSYGLLTLDDDALFEVYRCGSRQRRSQVVVKRQRNQT